VAAPYRAYGLHDEEYLKLKVLICTLPLIRAKNVEKLPTCLHEAPLKQFYRIIDIEERVSAVLKCVAP